MMLANIANPQSQIAPPLTAAERAARSVFVGNIPYEATEEQLKEIFAQVGPVVSFRLVYDRETGKPKGYGFCEYQDIETAQSAMRNLNNHDFNGRPLRVGVAAGEQNKDEMKSMQQALGGPPVESPYGEAVEPEKAPEAISRAVASLPPEQMYELMKQMKVCIQNNPNEARNMLLQNPQLAYALLQAQIVMKIVDPQVALAMLHRQTEQIPPLLPNQGDAEMKDVDMQQGVRIEGRALGIDGNGHLGSGMQDRLPTSVAASMSGDPSIRGPLLRAPGGPGGPSSLGPSGPMSRGPSGLLGDHPRVPGPSMNERMGGPGPRGPPMGGPGVMVRPRQEISGGPVPMDMGDVRGGGPPVRPDIRDPRQMASMGGPTRAGPGPGMAPATRPPTSMGGAPNMSASGGGSGLPGLGGITSSAQSSGPAVTSQDQEKAALIMQVLQLSDEQIRMLPPDQRQSILILKEQIARSTGSGRP